MYYMYYLIVCLLNERIIHIYAIHIHFKCLWVIKFVFLNYTLCMFLWKKSVHQKSVGVCCSKFFLIQIQMTFTHKHSRKAGPVKIKSSSQRYTKLRKKTIWRQIQFLLNHFESYIYIHKRWKNSIGNPKILGFDFHSFIKGVWLSLYVVGSNKLENVDE